MSIIRDATVDLGPREVILNAKIIAKVDNITLDVGKATEENVAALKTTPVIPSSNRYQSPKRRRYHERRKR